MKHHRFAWVVLGGMVKNESVVLIVLPQPQQLLICLDIVGINIEIVKNCSAAVCAVRVRPDFYLCLRKKHNHNSSCAHVFISPCCGHLMMVIYFLHSLKILFNPTHIKLVSEHSVWSEAFY